MIPVPKRSPYLGLLWLLALMLLRHSALAAPNDRDSRAAFSLVARALRARLHQTWTGRQEILFHSGKGGGWTHVIADIARDGPRSRMAYRFPASVADMLVADDGRHLRQFHPSCGLYSIRPSPPPEDVASRRMLSLLRRNYHCLARGEATANGRLCDLIALTPRFGPGPSRRCWIDRATQAILRTEEYNCVGRRQYVSFFTTIRFASRLPARLFSPAPPPGSVLQEAPAPPEDRTFAEARSQSGVDGRAPCWSPRGYRLFRCASLPRPRGTRALLLRYSDGLQTVSVYEEGAAPGLPPLPLQQRMLDDQLGRYGQQAWVRDLGGLRVTVVGSAALPPALGAEMMQSLDEAADQRLARALARDFGPSAPVRALPWRHQGWGYDQIAARLLSSGGASRRESQARAWVLSVLHSRRQTEP